MMRKIGFFIAILIFLSSGIAAAEGNQFRGTASPALRTVGGGSDPAAAAGIQGKEAQAIRASILRLPLSFIKNEGQADKSILFYEQGFGHGAAFTRTGVSLFLARPGKTGRGNKQEMITLAPVGSSPYAIEALEKKEGTINYFIGRDSKAWKTGIPTYGAVLLKGVYPGIDMKFYGSNSKLEYDIIVAPDEDPSKIRISCKGLERLCLTPGGELEMVMNSGSVLQKKPFVYQVREGRKTEVQGSFVLADSTTYGFKVGPYDRSLPLVIDPALVYSTFLGGSSNDSANAIAVDSSGNVYVAGTTSSTADTFPVFNAFQPANDGGFDAFITKLNPSGSDLVYSTFLGGSQDDSANGIAVDASGNVYVAGNTLSLNFPVVNPLQTHVGGFDAFVAKIGPLGNTLVYSTYLGGSSDDSANAIAVDTSGNAYVAGATASNNFPLQNPIRLYAAGFDAFVSKLNPSGSALVYSTYLGGFTDDFANAVAVDTSGNAYVAGSTTSTTFPVLNPVQFNNRGGSDAFITKIAFAGNALVYSTYLGGSSNDGANAIAVDAGGNAYVAGTTASNNFPVLIPFQTTLAGGSDAFITKIAFAGNALVYSTYLGGSSNDGAYAIAVDTYGSAYVAGATSSANFPIVNFIEPYAGGSDAFVARITPAGDSLVYSTYLGGASNDSAGAIAVDSFGDVYVAGYTLSTASTFPVINAFQPVNAGGSDAFIAKIDSSLNTFGLTVTKTGTGTGTVTSSPSRINCGSACSAGFAQGTVVTLTAVKGESSLFLGWGGNCSGSSDTCVVTMAGARSVTANFVPSSYTVTASVVGGHGTAGPAFQTVNYGASASVITSPDGGYHTDTIKDNGKSVTVANPYTINNVTANHSVAVTFSNKYMLTVQRSGSGTVTSSPSGIRCGTACSAAFTQDSVVTLTATHAADSIFVGWSGGGCSGSGTCAVTMNGKMSVTATFASAGYTITTSVPGGHGTATPSPPKVSYGGSTSIAITPDAGYYIVSISDNGKAAAIANPYVINNVTANHNVVVGLSVDYNLGMQMTGSGTVVSSPAGIDCTGTCSHAFREGTRVTLTPTPQSGFVFTGWTNDCKGNGACTVAMNGAKTVGAVFVQGSCTYVLSPRSRKFNYKGGSVTVGVSARDYTYCLPPEIIDNSAWITHTATPFTKNRGSVKLYVPALDSSIGRNDDISIGGNVFPVSQTGVPCTLNVTPAYSALLSGSGDTGFLNVEATPGDCGWTAAAQGTGSGWITIDSGATGTGNGTVNYTVGPNGTGRARNGRIAVTLTLSKKSRPYTVKQGAD